ncbi:hypothetical protein CH35J_007860 [Colletotrichum higginsianum]|uniref:Uncharacterized protein n=1 Tax=Colletotrichum higginsianum TaxID=80884 RepID=A0A4T0VU18_9PEZI|nr:hypothetical protein CH35J_007860 [Colletotrichum higginsianum]
MDAMRDRDGCWDPPPPYPGHEVSEDEARPSSEASRQPPSPDPSPGPSSIPVSSSTPSTAEFSLSRIVRGYRLDDSRRNYNLGPSIDHTLLRVCTSDTPRFMRTFYKTESAPIGLRTVVTEVVATIEEELCPTRKSHTLITLHNALDDRGEKTRVYMHTLIGFGGRERSAVAFQIEINGSLEMFQWRPSHGNEVKMIAGWASGWKLVRMRPPCRSNSRGAPKKRGKGFAGDGKEVVAVIATTMSSTRDFTFAFMGSGLDGSMGGAWATTAVASGVWTWWETATRYF